MNSKGMPGFALQCVCGLVWCVAFIGAACAQEYVTLVSFTNTWKYNQAGQNLGTDWVAPDYDDSIESWQSGPALFAFEVIPLPGNYYMATLEPQVIPTPLSLYSSGGTNGTNITFYFRTTFTNTLTNLAGVDLWATNLVDDGCVIYLNGTRAGHVRMPNTNQNYLSYPFGTLVNEGQFDNVSLPVSLLVRGTNSLAVEVHQGFLTSSDIAFAMRLEALVTTPLAISHQPPGEATICAGDDLMLTVGISGTPARCQWQRNGVNISAATNSTLLVPVVGAAHSGQYRCVVTNALTVITSTIANVSVLPDLCGPIALGARVVEAFGATNFISISFDEPIPLGGMASPNRNPANYRVVSADHPDEFLPIAALQGGGTNIVFRVATNWAIGGNYYLVLNNLVDSNANVIAPNTLVPISWPQWLDLVAPDTVWKYHAGGSSNYLVYYENWTSPGYIPGPWWEEGPSGFHSGSATGSQCLGPAQTAIGFQFQPILFRTTFYWAAADGPRARLILRSFVDDGLVLYLNGREIFRNNVTSPIDFYTRASNPIPSSCTTNGFDVFNLAPGTNWLAAAVIQATNEMDITFDLGLRTLVYVHGPAPENPAPALAAAPSGTNSICLSWDGYGYALETTTNLALGLESYPSGPWVPAANMSNPYTNNLASPERFFRLRK